MLISIINIEKHPYIIQTLGYFTRTEISKSLFGNEDIEKILEDLKSLNKIFIITAGESGAILVNKKEVIRVNSEKIENIVDLTGAGDLFAAGFIHGFVNKIGFEKSLKLGVKSASEIIKILGARPKIKLKKILFQ